ncbi:MAG: peptidase U32 family protein [Georgfuchsia sp.]
MAAVTGHRPQLLAPAGSVGMAVAAVDAGADVLYVGPRGWSRRPAESELTDDEIRTAIDYARARDRELRVVLNTYPSPFEMEAFVAKAQQYASWGASGFIVTDPGAISRIRDAVPGTVLHVSIGSGICNADDCAFYRDIGADKIILPYRWGGAEVEAAKHRSDIGLEVFLFETVQTGKICPGKCIMSSYLRFREWQPGEGKDYFYGSANRGAKECYRVCQTTWEFGAEDELSQTLKLRRDARLMLEQLPEFVHLGVEYFKLSGRERPTEMIRDLVRYYRCALDHVIGGDNDIQPFVEELVDLRQRWISAKGRRTNLLMARAETYGISGKLAGQGA